MNGSPLSPSSHPSAWHGQLHLEFRHRDLQTLLSYNHAQAPLKIQRSFYPEGLGICHSVMLHTAGGIVGGDLLSLKVRLHPHAQVLVTTAAAAKIYRSNGQEAQHNTQISVAEGGCLEWLPQDTIVFNGAMYRQTLRVDLAPGAMWMGWDITRLGRTARGESFETGTWRSHTEVWQGDRLIWVDPQWIQGGSEMLDSLHGLAGFPVIGSFAMIGQPVTADLLTAVRSLWQNEDPQNQELTGQLGVTRLMNGLLCRYRGHSATEARRWFIQIWHVLRHQCLGRSGCVPRVWQV